MAMGVNYGVNGAIVPAPNRGKGLACRIWFSRVYEDESGCGADDGDTPAKVCCVDGDDVFGDGGYSAVGDGLRPLFHRRCAVPEPLEKLVLFHCTHPSRVSLLGDSASRHTTHAARWSWRRLISTR